MALGVSCATPILAPVLGTLSVASASVAAAQVLGSYQFHVSVSFQVLLTLLLARAA